LLTERRSVVMINAFHSPESIAADIRSLKLAAVIGEARDWSGDALAAIDELGSLAIALDSAGATPVSVIRPFTPRGDDQLRAPLPVPGVEMLTSGTTGKPKRIPLSFDLMARSMIGESMLHATSSEAAPVLVTFPFGNISGLYHYLPAAAAGMRMILCEKFDLATWIDYVRTWKPRKISLPPAGIRQLIDLDTPRDAISSLDYLTTGATRLDPDLQDEFEQRYGIPVLLSLWRNGVRRTGLQHDCRGLPAVRPIKVA